MKIVIGISLIVAAFGADVAANALHGNMHMVLALLAGALFAVGVALTVTTEIFWEFVFGTGAAGVLALVVACACTGHFGSAFGAFAGVYYAAVIFTVIAFGVVQAAVNKHRHSRCDCS
jgi:hypothetical protein